MDGMLLTWAAVVVFLLAFGPHWISDWRQELKKTKSSRRTPSESGGTSPTSPEFVQKKEDATFSGKIHFPKANIENFLDGKFLDYDGTIKIE